MNKAELEKEATEWVRQKFPMLSLKQSDMSKIYEYEAYLAGAEPREKQIAELKQKLETERSSRIALVNKIAELEAQIEKMKCCYNCKHSRTEYEHCKTDKHEKWEIKK